MKIAEGQHTPYQIALGKSDYKVRGCALSSSTFIIHQDHPSLSNIYIVVIIIIIIIQGEDQHNWTAHRQRGYKIGSLNQGPDEPDKYWKQPGHPLHPASKGKGGRFEVSYRHQLYCCCCGAVVC